MSLSERNKKCYFNPRITCQYSRGSRQAKGWLYTYLFIPSVCESAKVLGEIKPAPPRRTSANTMAHMRRAGQSFHPQLPWARLSLSYWHKLRLMRDEIQLLPEATDQWILMNSQFWQLWRKVVFLISHFFECFRLFLPYTVLLYKVKTRVGELLLFRVCWFCLKFANKTLIILNNRSILFFKNMAALL